MASLSAATHFDGDPAIKRGPNKVGRPRAFQDDDVYRVMMGVISNVGYARLTFALIAAEIKCTTSALIRRFGDKRSLVQGFILWITRQQEELFSHSEGQNLSPLDVLRARFYLPVAGVVQGTSEDVRNAELFLAFFIEARSEPAYRPQLARLTSEFETQATDTIRAAIKAGQLKSCDEADLAHTLVVALVGAQSLWLDHRRGSMIDEMDRVWSAVLRPYLA